MKNTKTCPKCNGKDILFIKGNIGPYGTGNNIITGFTIFSGVEVNRYLCCTCGYSEEWVNKSDIEKLRNSYKTIEVR